MWSRIKSSLVSTDREFAYFKGLSFVGFVGTLIVAYFQYLSAYQDKVSTQSKEDLAAATSAFMETSDIFSTAITLQQIVFFDYKDAIQNNLDRDDNAMATKNARDAYKNYDGARTSLRQKIDVLARKMEIYIDWPSDLRHDPAKPAMLGADPMTLSELGAYQFDCDKYMPNFSTGFDDIPAPENLLKQASKPQPLRLDWYSAKHHLLALDYCFQTSHAALKIPRQWASNSSVDAAARARFITEDNLERAQNNLDQLVLRLNAFMSLAMQRIEEIRVRYRPNGFLCHIPMVREGIGLFSLRCSPIRTADR